MVSTPPLRREQEAALKGAALALKGSAPMGAVGEADALAVGPANNAILPVHAPTAGTFRPLAHLVIFWARPHRPLTHPDSPTVQPSELENESTTTDTTTNLANSSDALARQPVDPPTPRTPPRRPLLPSDSSTAPDEPTPPPATPPSPPARQDADNANAEDPPPPSTC
jgi:hypothetical protein